jgi:RNA polymerase sigma factor (sigma-70 family)
VEEIEKLYRLYKQDVYAYLISLTHNPILSEDLLSETFIAAISALRNFKGKSSIKTWLFSIARNLWISRLRKEKPTLEYNDFLGLYISDSMAEGLINKEIAKRIQDLLSEKDNRTQKIVNMRIEGFSYREISDSLNISESTARVIDFRTKKWIKNIIEKEEQN